jgi:mono/diheme cytochrome c family protein
MKRLLRFALVGLLAVIVVDFLVVFYVVYFLPNIPVENVKIEATPERLARGKYLAENVAGCTDCHSTRDWSKFSAPVVPGTEGKGGGVFDQKLGFPGKYVAPNITPFHLKDWSDGEVLRAITNGVGKDGRALFPLMPYTSFGKMDKEDIYSIVAYIRNLPPVENTPPNSESDFPMNVIIHTIPSANNFTPKPPTTDKLNYGRYLANAASCVECHTEATRGQLNEAKLFGGGRFFETPAGTSVSANITPDKETGIGNWTEETFVQRFKAFDKTVNNASGDVNAEEFNTEMPWTNFSGMTEEDLAAIYTYLRTVKPVSNKVAKVFIKKGN